MNAILAVKICVTAGAFILIAIHQWMPITLDTLTSILLVVALAPWLQPLVKSVEMLGIKLELQDLQEKVAIANGAAENAKSKAIFAQSASEPTDHLEDASLVALAEQYEHIRSTQVSGDPRTLAMTTVVHKIIELAPRNQDFNVAAALVDKRSGIRLVAYALLYATPAPTYLETLVQSVTTIEDKPFGQYWGLQAISRVVDSYLEIRSVPPQVTTQLREFGTRIPRGTDRDYELRQILELSRSKS